MIFTVIGGDERQVFLAELLRKAGHSVRMCGFEKYSPYVPCVNTGDALLSCDCAVLPLPSTKDGETVFTPLYNGKIYIEDILRGAGKDTIFFTAGLDLPGLRCCDYFAREELAVLNAVPTAEGAVQLALSATKHALMRSRCLVIGFGRIGKLLCHRLSPFGCDITATARSKKDLAWIEAYGYDFAETSEIENIIDRYDIIFNTVPYHVITEKALKKVKKDSVIIELASPPYGTDTKLASKLGVNIMTASGLPAKIAPRTAADIIFSTICNILDE